MFMNLETHNKRYQNQSNALLRVTFGIKFVKIRQTAEDGQHLPYHKKKWGTKQHVTFVTLIPVSLC